MTGQRVTVTLPSNRNTFGILVGPAFPEGPSMILVDGMAPARLVERADWEFLPVEQEPDHG